MINEENKTELIDLYLNNKLDGELLAAFEKKLKEDPDFRLDVEAQKAAISNINLWGREDMRDRFRQIHRELKPESVRETGKVRPLKVYWAIAAAIFLCLVAGIAFYLSRDTTFDGSRIASSESNIRMIPVYEAGENGLGFAGKGTDAVDSLVLVLARNKNYPHHYQFMDTLKVFTDRAPADISSIFIEYNNKTDTYLLLIDSAAYEVERGFGDINALKEKEK